MSDWTKACRDLASRELKCWPIEITEDHIDSGARYKSHKCPISLGIEDEGMGIFADVETQKIKVRCDGTETDYVPEQGLSDWIKLFDKGHSMYPLVIGLFPDGSAKIIARDWGS